MLTKVEGIVIRAQDYGEGNKIIHLYTRELGKLPVMVRGARKSKSRFSGASQLFAYGEYVTYGSGNMPTLNQADLIHTYPRIQKDLNRIYFASYMAEFISKLTEDRERNPYVFELLKQSLDHLEEGKDVEIIMRIFEMKMMALAGISPQLDQCVSCASGDLPSRFSLRHGGLVCERCRHTDPAALELTPSTIKLLRLFQHFDLKRLGKIDVKTETRKQMRLVINQFMDEHLGVRLKSREIIDQLVKGDQGNDDGSGKNY